MATLNVSELRQKLREMNLSPVGNRATLQRRLEDAEDIANGYAPAETKRDKSDKDKDKEKEKVPLDFQRGARKDTPVGIKMPKKKRDKLKAAAAAEAEAAARESKRAAMDGSTPTPSTPSSTTATTTSSTAAAVVAPIFTPERKRSPKSPIVKPVKQTEDEKKRLAAALADDGDDNDNDNDASESNDEDDSDSDDDDRRRRKKKGRNGKGNGKNKGSDMGYDVPADDAIDDNEPLAKANVRLKDRVATLTALCKRQEDKIYELAAVLTESDNFEKLYNEEKAKVAILKKEAKQRESLHERVITSRTEITKLTKELAAARTNASELQSQVARLRSDIVPLQERAASSDRYRNENNALEAALRQLRTESKEAVRLDPRNARDGGFEGFTPIELESLSTMYMRAAAAAHATVVIRMRADHDRMAAELKRQQLVVEEQEVKRKEREMCKICFEVKADHVFIPCGHYVCCGRCATACAQCPLCRRAVTARNPIFT